MKLSRFLHGLWLTITTPSLWFKSHDQLVHLASLTYKGKYITAEQELKYAREKEIN